MAQTSSPSFPSKDASISSVPSPAVAVPDAKAARDAQGHYPQVFKLAAVRYAASCGKSQRAAAKDLGLSDGTLGDWTRDAQPDSAGIVDAARFDELAQLRTQNLESTNGHRGRPWRAWADPPGRTLESHANLPRPCKTG